MNKFETITFEREERIATVTINRPEAMNALNALVIDEICQVLDVLETEDTIQIVVFTGTGKAFVAGADIVELSSLTPRESRALAMKGSKMMERIDFLEQPTIAAINGFALGGGCELALSCDLRIASSKAMFGQPEVALGITPGFSGTQRLPRVIGHARAKEMILTGDYISAQEAERIGLVNKVVEPEELMKEVRLLAERILKNAPIAVRYSNVAIQQGSEQDINTGITIESAMFDLCFATEDHKEGMSAFLEKRKAQFHNR